MKFDKIFYYIQARRIGINRDKMGFVNISQDDISQMKCISTLVLQLNLNFYTKLASNMQNKGQARESSYETGNGDKMTNLLTWNNMVQ